MSTAFGTKIEFVVTAAGLREAELLEQCKSTSCCKHCSYGCGYDLGDGQNHGHGHADIVHVVGNLVDGHY